ncbi:unnamed protein product [Polarella glacialis]|uniref:Uncharacterized protein n=1 Tax=Polarella glacialis TaxID=89957 RepID=A0A813K5Z3_POLGL|nr:unnamed protein product [Polarella glacialis]CAE8692154.1 unnamed protein product [Polarella glacialis]
MVITTRSMGSAGSRAATPAPKAEATAKAQANAAASSPTAAKTPPTSPKKASTPKKLRRDLSSPPPAILGYGLSDLLSLAICGYIGGRCMQLKFPGPATLSAAWWGWSLAAAMVTSFGGGTYYTLLMKQPGDRGFGWQDPVAVAAAALGVIVSAVLVPACGHSGSPRLEDHIGLGCGEVFGLFDIVNSGILIAWGCSKSFVDSSGWQNPITRFLCTIVTTYVYSFGGGITRDLVARLLIGSSAGSVGNFSPEVVLPAIASTAFFYCLLVFKRSPFLQLGVGLPTVMLLFHAAGLAFA